MKWKIEIYERTGAKLFDTDLMSTIEYEEVIKVLLKPSMFGNKNFRVKGTCYPGEDTTIISGYKSMIISYKRKEN